MSWTRTYLPPALAAVVGIANGVYIFKPSILEEREKNSIKDTLTPQSEPIREPGQTQVEEKTTSTNNQAIDTPASQR
ncbi:hypothetical protein DL546_007007 [Coniochaeta pulveracea]|uniref:Uncharacterized protein n=1 Tax=Coniochaeta pulveracea TaxID=177199 RepID=A0A420YA78_9PEZI|nr:hypothetical protein DL546_007007 [Coniochaeta pulveracea]